MSEDPAGFIAGDLNLYRYVDNNPLSYTDPRGNNKKPGRGLTQGEIAVLILAAGALAVKYVELSVLEGLFNDLIESIDQLNKGTVSNTCGPSDNSFEVAVLQQRLRQVENQISDKKFEIQERKRRNNEYINYLLGIGVDQNDINRFI